VTDQTALTAYYGDDPDEYIQELYLWWTEEEPEDPGALVAATLKLMEPQQLDFINAKDLESGDTIDQDFWLGEVLNAAVRAGVEQDTVDEFFADVLG
jgi:hypothetical protein